MKCSVFFVFLSTKKIEDENEAVGGKWMDGGQKMTPRKSGIVMKIVDMINMMLA